MAIPSLVTGTASFQNTETAGAVTNFTVDSGSTGLNRGMVVGIPYEQVSQATPADVTSATYNGVGLTQAIHVDSASVSGFAENMDIWVLAAPTTGSNTLTINLANSSNRDLAVMIGTFQDVDQSTIFDATNSFKTAATSDPETLGLTTLNSDSLAIFSSVHNSADNPVAISGSGVTVTSGVSGTGSTGFSGLLVSAGSASPATVTSGFTTAGTDASIIAAIELLAASSINAAITGTATAGISEDDITAGGKTIIISLTDDTWVTAGATFDAQRQNIIDGLDAATSPASGWNLQVRDNEVVTAVVRTSATVVTVTLTAQAGYDITAQETITVTVPNTALVTSTGDLTGSPTFTVDPVSASFQPFFAVNTGGLIQ